MKKTLLFIWGLLCCCQIALAQEYFERDGISYRVIAEADEAHLSGTVVVTAGEYQGEIIIPNGVKQSDDEFADTYRVIGVDESAFEGSRNLTKVTLPLSVEYIGRWAFKDTPLLEEVVLTTGKLTTIGISAFMKSGIKSITIPRSVKTIEATAFFGCSNLKQVFIPANVRKIGIGAFLYCDNLSEVVFEEGCKKIPLEMFRGCNNIWRVTIPTTMLEIARDAFTSSNIKKVYVPQSCNVSEGAFNKNTIITHDSKEQPEQKKMDIGDTFMFNDICYTIISLPSDSTKAAIEVSGSNTHVALYAVEIPSSITDSETKIKFDVIGIREHGILNSQIVSIILPNSIEYIQQRAFFGCSSLTSVTIGNGVKSIGDYAFFGCSSLTSVTIGNGVTSIGDYAFSNCRSLEILDLSLTKINVLECYTCLHCTSLKKVTLPRTLERIKANAFKNCPLETVIIPPSVANIEYGALYGAHNVIVEGNPEKWGSVVFNKEELQSVKIMDCVYKSAEAFRNLPPEKVHCQ